jgi:hypothetical protein
MKSFTLASVTYRQGFAIANVPRGILRACRAGRLALGAVAGFAGVSRFRRVAIGAA